MLEQHCGSKKKKKLNHSNSLIKFINTVKTTLPMPKRDRNTVQQIKRTISFFLSTYE